MKYTLQMQTGVCGMAWTFSFHAEDDFEAKTATLERYLSGDNLTERCMAVILWEVPEGDPNGRFVAKFVLQEPVIAEVKYSKQRETAEEAVARRAMHGSAVAA